MTNTNIETVRTLSKLTDRPHIIEIENKRLVAFAGVVLPLCSFSMMFMWALAGSYFYHSIFQEQTELVKECIDLNPDLLNFSSVKRVNQVGPLITGRFRELLSKLKPEEIEELVDHMFAEYES